MLLLKINPETILVFCAMFFGLALIAGLGFVYKPEQRKKSTIIGVSIELAIAFVLFALICAKLDKGITNFKIEEAKYKPKGAKVRVYSNKYGVNRGMLTNGIFQVSDQGKKICFSSGNMQVRLSDTTFTIAQHQYQVIGVNDSCRDLLKRWEIDAIDYGNRKWRIINANEWEYILEHYPHKWMTVNGVEGLVILQNNMKSYVDTINSITKAHWLKMQDKGAVFLPAAGYYIPPHGFSKDIGGYYDVYGKRAPGRGPNKLIIHFTQECESEYILETSKYHSARFVTTIEWPHKIK